jgi:hypothetical protein
MVKRVSGVRIFISESSFSDVVARVASKTTMG